jgi:hypothetical protein
LRKTNGHAGSLTEEVIDDLNRHEEARHMELKDFFKSEIRRVEERIARLEQPIIRS